MQSSHGRNGFKGGLLVVGLVVGGCTSILGIDGDYVSAIKGGEGSGAAAGGAAGGPTDAAASGGAPSTIGEAPTCTEDGSVSCSADSKCCAGACVAPEPAVGCGRASCEACAEPPVAAGYAVCTAAGGCAVHCNVGYGETDGTCVKNGTGGATGAGGAVSSGGAPSTGGAKSSGGAGGKPACDVKACTNSCNITSPARCCDSTGACGCTWAPGAYCT